MATVVNGFPSAKYPQTARAEGQVREYLKRWQGGARERLEIDGRLMGQDEAFAFFERVLAVGKLMSDG